MKITAIETRVLKIPASGDPLSGTAGLHGTAARLSDAPANEYQRIPPFRTAFPTKVQTLFVRIFSEDGLVGVGECQAPVVPEAPHAIIRHLLAPLLLGQDPFDRDALWEQMYLTMRDRGHFTGFMLDAISALDIALWDLAGKALALPVYKLLGGAFRPEIPVYVSGLSGATLPERIENARAHVARGFRALKLFLGHGIEADLQEVAAVRDAVGGGVTLLVDVQWVYDVSTAIRLGRALEKYDVAWLETPSNPEDLAGHAEICAALDLPIASGECERTRAQFRSWLESRALDIAQPDVGRAGGITESRKIAALAETFNVPCALHLGVGLAPYIAASVQLAAAVPNLLSVEYQPTMFALANSLLAVPLVAQNGIVTLPAGPGLGIELNLAAVDPFTVERSHIGEMS